MFFLAASVASYRSMAIRRLHRDVGLSYLGRADRLHFGVLRAPTRAVTRPGRPGSLAACAVQHELSARLAKMRTA